jgi:hypothetical protein
MDLEEIVEKWETVGLLSDLPNEWIKQNLALTYEKMSTHLLDNDTRYGDLYLNTAAFPITYRICKTGLIITNIEHFLGEMNNFFRDNRHILEGNHGYTHMDIESELCRIFAEDYIEWLKDNPQNLEPNKFLPRHNL